jgi:4'-phosphopantetheinyl transferase
LAYDERQGSQLPLKIQSDDFSSVFPGNASLEETETHVIRASLLLSATAIRQVAASLSQDERERAAGFHVEKHRRRFIASRGLLRVILGTYLDAAPGSLRFVYSPNGKPGLDKSCHARGVVFSVSHSEELALYAIAREAAVGVDIEQVSRRMDLDKIAKKFFSSAEYEVYVSLPREENTEAFYRCWTRKEAFVKAGGEGWIYPADAFDVSVVGRAQLLSMGGSRALAGEWSIHHLSPAKDFIGALAIKSKACRVRSFSYEA